MLRATLRGLIAHKVRLGLTGLAIVLAVGFVSGTFVFTDSLHAALSNLVSSRQPDVVVSAKSDFSNRYSDSLAPQTLSADLVGKIEKLPGAQTAVGWVQVRNVAILGPDGLPVGGGHGPGGTGQGQSWIDDDQLAVVQLDVGVPPTGPDQVAIDTTTAKGVGLQVGDQVPVVLPDGSTVRPAITALVNRGLSGGSGPAGSVVIWDLPTAQRLLLSPGQVTQVRVSDAPGVSQEIVAAEVKSVAPAAKIQTGQQISDTTAATLSEQLGFLNTILLVFALISLFVASFLIYNTFAMLVAQRTRELALLRAIGATRRQVIRSVLLEAVLVGIAASTVGIAVGVGIAQLLRGIFAAMGAPLPAGGFVVEPRTVWVSYAVGVLVTLVSAWFPAQRAAAIAPVAALRTELAWSAPGLRLRTSLGTGLVVIAVAAAGLGVRTTDDSGSNAAGVVGLSALTALVGMLLVAPVLARLVLPVLALPFRWSATGRLARENGRRNPRRTAATASALMIGLTLMTALSVLAASVTASTNGMVDRVIGADFVVLGDGFRPVPTAAYQALRGTPGTSTITYVRGVPARAEGATDDTLVVGVDPKQIGGVVTLDMTAGGVSDLAVGTTLLDTRSARDQGVQIGSDVRMKTVNGTATLKIIGLYEPSGFYTGYVTTIGQVDAMGAAPTDMAIYIKAAQGADLTTVRAELERRLKPFPAVQLQDQTQFKQQIADQVSQLLVFILALLVLAVLIAVLGIVNTLTLSVFERTRELGLLRALGTMRSQVRRMVLIESVLIAVFGALLGLLLGTGYGVLLQRVLAGEGINELGIDAGQLVGFLVLAIVGGVFAAVWPAWRASRLNVLQAIAVD